jgi:2-polyprenyl-3-methyl-5-hydroxy-6-metoxy-1,4-benzoquinol methylase
MKNILLRIISTKLFSNIFLIPLLKIHNYIYSIVSILVVIKHNGIHPKHDIIKYEKWFLDSIKPGDNVLDIGCNQGGLALLLSQKAGIVYGIEIEKKHYQVAISKPQNSKVKFILGDATTFDYSKLEPIDVIVMSNVLEHIPQRINFLREILKSVKWKSELRLLIRVPNLERDWLTVYKKNIGIEYRLDKTHFIEHTIIELEEELRAAKVEVKKSFVKFGEIFVDCLVLR